MVKHGADVKPERVTMNGRTFKRANYSSGAGTLYIEETDFGYRRR